MARPPSELGDIRTSPRNQKILRWLRRQPQPVKIVGETLEGEERSAIVAKTGPTQWTDVLGIVRECCLLKAQDKDGNEMRRLELDPDDPELRAEREAEEAAKSIARYGTGGSVPIISVDLPKLVDNIARNMREVASEAARSHSSATRDGWQAMVGVVNVAMKLLVAMEQRLQVATDAVAPEGEPDENDQRNGLAMMALQKALGNGASNGAGGGGFDPNMLAALLQRLQQNPSGGADHE